MKAVLIMHNVALDRDVNEALQSLGVDCYTKFTDTLGKGKMSEPHLNSDVWPGVNYGTLLIVEESKAKEIMDKVRRMREKLAPEGIKAFMWQIDGVT